MEQNSTKPGGSLRRPQSVHSLRSALKTLDLPSMPPSVPLPPLPTSPTSTRSTKSIKSTKSRSTTLRGSPRPMTGSTKKPSLTSISWRPYKPTKYGSGRFSNVELVPQPSDDPQDPLVSFPNLPVPGPYDSYLDLLELASMEERTQLGIATFHGLLDRSNENCPYCKQ
jgi:hypothetical protein